MRHYPLSIQKLIKNFSKLPGIGEKTAERLSIHILKCKNEAARELSISIMEVKEKIKFCNNCYSLCEGEFCKICSDKTRDESILCIVENPADMIAIEKSGGFNGLYHVLQGVLSPIDNIGPDDIRIKELLDRINRDKIKEIIIATSTNFEGETTATYIAESLSNYSIKISRIASGIPIGGDIKYIDQVTIKKAMETRHSV